MPDETPPTLDPVSAVSALGEPSRRALYDYVIAAGRWVGRDEAADAASLQRAVAAHHLDRLASDGLLEFDFQRLSGRTGPGAGRPAKVYRRAPRDIDVAFPPRDYQLAGRLLADAVAESTTTGIDISLAVEHAATAAGERLGRDMRELMGRRRSSKSARRAALETLQGQGFEPVESDDGTVLLRNCPFHLLAGHQTELICGMNHCMITAALGELDSVDLRATLEPDADSCCVRLRPIDHTA